MRQYLKIAARFLLKAIKITVTLSLKLALILSLIYIAINAEEIKDRILFQSSVDKIFYVFPNETHGGTGFSIKGKSGKNYIVTNDHICMGSKDGYVTTMSERGKKWKNKILYRHPKSDLCIVQGIKGAPALELADSYALYEFVKVVGHPNLFALNVSNRGSILGRTTTQIPMSLSEEPVPGCDLKMPKFKMMKVDIANIREGSSGIFDSLLYPSKIAELCFMSSEGLVTTSMIVGGNSGSPVLDMSGKVVGVAYAASRGEPIGFFIPLDVLREMLNRF